MCKVTLDVPVDARQHDKRGQYAGNVVRDEPQSQQQQRQCVDDHEDMALEAQDISLLDELVRLDAGPGVTHGAEPLERIVGGITGMGILLHDNLFRAVEGGVSCCQEIRVQLNDETPKTPGGDSAIYYSIFILYYQYYTL